MKILTTTLCYPTPDHPDQGIFVQRRALAVGNRSGVAVRVVSPQPCCPLLRKGKRFADRQQPLSATYPKMLSVPVLGWAADGWAYARCLESVIRAEGGSDGAGVDLIDAHFEYPDGVGAWLVGRRLGIPVIVTARGKIVSLSRRAIRRLQIGAMLRGVDGIIAVSRSLAGWVHRIAGTDLHVDVIPNGVDATVYHLADRQTAREALSWHPHARYIVSVGHLQRVKGFDRLVAAMPAIRSALGDVRLMLVGSQRGERRFRTRLERTIASCNRQISHAGHGPVITFVGTVASEELNLMYNAADLVVNTSRSEGWNNAISESLATGTPVVATDVGGNPEQICSEELGMIVPDGDRPALQGAVIAALSRPWNRLLISAHGGARTWTCVAKDVAAVFARVLHDYAARHAGKASFFGPQDKPTAPAIEVCP